MKKPRALLHQIVVFFIAFLASTASCFENLLSGSSIYIYTDSSTTWTTSWLSSAQFSTNVTSDALISEFGQQGKCSQVTTAGATITFEIILPSPVYFRSLLIVLTDFTLTDNSFTGYSYKAYSGSTETDSRTSLTKSTVVYNDGDRVQADKIQLQMVAGSTASQLCLDSVMATDSYYLNGYAEIGQEKTEYDDGSYNNTKYYDSDINRSPWHSEWEQQDCAMSNDFSGQTSPDFSSHKFAMKFNPESDFSSINSTVLIVSMALQFGEKQLFETSQNWRIATQPQTYDAGTDDFTLNLYSNQVTGISGSQYQIFDSPLSTSKVILQSNNVLNEICSFQNFGYKYCEFTWSDTSTFELYVPSGTTEAVTITKVFAFTYTIGDVGLEDVEFCRMGISAEVIYDTQSDPTVTITTSIDDMTVTLTADQSLSSSDATSSLTLSLCDTRNPFVASTLVGTLQYKNACTLADLAGVQILNSDGVSPLQSVTYHAYVTGEANPFTYSVSSFPTCSGFLPASGYVEVTAVLENGDELYLNTDYAEYVECVFLAQTLCQWHDQSTYTLYWNINDESMVGVSTIFFKPTMVGYDGSDATSTVSLEYAFADSGSLTFTLYSCIYTVFDTPSDSLTSPATVGVPNFATEVLYDPDGDESYPWSSKQLSIADSLSSSDSTYCGERTFLVTSGSSLAETLLTSGCTSCLTVTESEDGYSVVLAVRIMDTDLASQVLDFTLTVYLKDYHTNEVTDEPVGYNDFTVTINAQDSSCVVTDATLTSEATSFTYTIGSSMTPLQFDLQRSPACITEGTLSFSVDSITDLTEIFSLYGVTVTENTDTDGQVTNILLSTSYYLEDLADRTLSIEIGYSIGDYTWAFPTIAALYEWDSSSEQAADTASFTLQSSLTTPDSIPCLDDNSAVNWFYQFPAAQQSGVSYEFEAPDELSSVMKFYESQRRVYLETETGSLPGDDSYVGKYVLKDSEDNFRNFELSFSVECESSLASDSEDDSSYEGNSFAGVDITNIDEYEEPQSPVPSISTITSKGTIHIYWSEPMRQQTELQILNSRGLQSQQQSSSSSLLDVSLIQKSDQDVVEPLALNFTYTFEWTDSQTSEIVVIFNKPEYVSIQSSKKDLIMIKFNDTSVFYSEKGLPMDPHFQIVQAMPKQLPKEGAVEINVKKLQTAGLATLGVGLVLSFFISALLNQLLSIIDNLSIVAHMFILSIQYPTNTQEFFQGLFPLITFDMFPTTKLYQWMFDFEHTRSYPISDQFDMVGYQQTFIIENLGSLYLIIIVTPVFITILALLNRVTPFWRACNCCKKRIQPRIDNYFKTFFWNGLITFIDSGYLVFTITSMIGVVDLRFEEQFSSTEKYNSMCAIFGLAVCVAFPFVIGLIYCRKIKSSTIKPDLHDLMTLEELRLNYVTIDVAKINKMYTESEHKAFLERYGCLIENIRLKELGKSTAIVASLLPIFRRLIFSGAIIQFIYYPTWSIFMFNFLILFYIIFIDFYHIYDSKSHQRQHIMNEYVLLIANYHLFCFTEWCNMEQKQIAGNNIIYFVATETLIFFVWTVVPYFNNVHLKCRRKYFRQKALRLRKSIPKESRKNLVKPDPEVRKPKDEPNQEVGSAGIQQQMNETARNTTSDQKQRRQPIVQQEEPQVILLARPSTGVDEMHNVLRKQQIQQQETQMLSLIRERLASIESVDEAVTEESKPDLCGDVTGGNGHLLDNTFAGEDEEVERELAWQREQRRKFMQDKFSSSYGGQDE